MLIGLTGGIASGKSTVSRLLAGRGAIVVDADQVAREVVEPGTEGHARVVEAFGSGILQPDGSLDRSRLADIVFPDPAALAKLEAITHPLIARRTEELLGTAQTQAEAVVVHDHPLLVERGDPGRYDLVVVVEAPEEERIRRMVRDRGMTVEQARARLAAQATDSERRAAADMLIVNEGSLEQLEEKTNQLWASLAGMPAPPQPLNLE